MTNALKRVRARADAAASAPYTLIAVTKRRTIDEILPLLDAGHRDFGENTVQEATKKWSFLKKDYPDVRLHFIGNLQLNKVKQAVMSVDTFHSVDSTRLIDKIISSCKQTGRIPSYFLQVNIGKELQKSGCLPEDAADLCKYAHLQYMPFTGLMCIPPAGQPAIPFFTKLRTLGQQAALPHLSMGMSADYEDALRNGATHIRVGSALFSSS